MEPRRDNEPRHLGARLPRIILPPYNPPTPENLERRQNAAKEILRMRSEIGPLGRSVTDLIREDRDSH